MNWRDLIPWGRQKSSLDEIRDALARMGGASTSSGKNITVKTAIQVSTVFAVCRVIGEGIAQVPLKLMRESADGKTRQPAREHPLYNVLAFKPNTWQTSFEYREMIAWHIVLTGQHISFINRARGGKIYELIPFEPGQVTVKRDEKTRKLSYEARGNDGSVMLFPAEAIWHVRGPSWDGFQGLEAVRLAREAIGLALATEEATSSLHKNGVRPSGVYSVDGVLKDDQYKALTNWIERNLSGGENAGKALILDRAAKWVNTQMTGIDAQTLEQRRFQIEEICRFARVMPIMVGYSDKATTYASSEQMFLAHVVHTLAPWYQRLEQSIDANLLTDADRADGLYANFVEEGLLRGSTVDTKDTLLGYVNGGLMTANEARAKLDLNPDIDPASDKLRIPANIVGAIPDADAPSKEMAKGLDDLRMEIKSNKPPAQHPQNINISIDAPITMPDMKAGDISVNVEPASITLPEMKAADVHVNVEPAQITMPEVKAGDVHVNVEPPITQLEATLPTPTVIVSLPNRKTVGTIERDTNGNIVKTTQVETDA